MVSCWLLLRSYSGAGENEEARRERDETGEKKRRGMVTASAPRGGTQQCMAARWHKRSAGCRLRRIFKCIWFQRKLTNFNQTMRSILELNLKFGRKQSCREFKEPQLL